jgi:hypothetical protein
MPSLRRGPRNSAPPRLRRKRRLQLVALVRLLMLTSAGWLRLGCGHTVANPKLCCGMLMLPPVRLARLPISLLPPRSGLLANAAYDQPKHLPKLSKWLVELWQQPPWWEKPKKRSRFNGHGGGKRSSRSDATGDAVNDALNEAIHAKRAKHGAAS